MCIQTEKVGSAAQQRENELIQSFKAAIATYPINIIGHSYTRDEYKLAIITQATTLWAINTWAIPIRAVTIYATIIQALRRSLSSCV